MKNVWIVITVAIVFLVGCMTVRTYTVEKPRTDTGIEGNRGYLTGGPSDEPPKNKFGDTRKISVFEIELEDRAKGTSTVQEPVEAEDEMVMETEDESFFDYDDSEDVAYVEEITIAEPEEPEAQQYIVQKYDTLQKISYKFYGTTKKWKYLYNMNKSVIKNPDKLYPGMKLSIPSLD